MPYNPDSRFSLSALCRLEAAGIRVLRSLSGSVDRLCKELGVNGYKYKFISDYTIERAMTSWVAGECGPEYPPTWDGLLRLMWKLRLKELSRRVEEFFNSKCMFGTRVCMLVQEFLSFSAVSVCIPGLNITVGHRPFADQIN